MPLSRFEKSTIILQIVIATHERYFTYKRLPFGIRLAPSFVQCTMNQILSGIKGVVCYLDDILVTAPNSSLHSQRLKEILQLFGHIFTYLGHKMDGNGFFPTDKRTEAIKNLPISENSTLLSFLCAISYYGRFIKNLHVKCAPLYHHLKKWKWSDEDTSIVNELKQSVTSKDTLAHYDTVKLLVASSDDGNVCVETVLSHQDTET